MSFYKNLPSADKEQQHQSVEKNNGLLSEEASLTKGAAATSPQEQDSWYKINSELNNDESTTLRDDYNPIGLVPQQQLQNQPTDQQIGFVQFWRNPFNFTIMTTIRMKVC